MVVIIIPSAGALNELVHVKHLEQCQVYSTQLMLEIIIRPLKVENADSLFPLFISPTYNITFYQFYNQIPLKVPSRLPHCFSLRPWQAPPNWCPCFHVSLVQSNLPTASRIIFLKCTSGHVTLLLLFFNLWEGKNFFFLFYFLNFIYLLKKINLI